MDSFLSDTFFKSFSSTVNMFFLYLWFKHCNRWIFSDIGRNYLLGNRKKIAKFLMRTWGLLLAALPFSMSIYNMFSTQWPKTRVLALSTSVEEEAWFVLWWKALKNDPLQSRGCSSVTNFVTIKWHLARRGSTLVYRCRLSLCFPCCEALQLHRHI
jgi:hypothetical protein